ncbi:hypothetical protein B0T17DRAFT_523014 [Bombardia bombarda]|uniref:Aminoglycoside phosphotransferase domain-containing protein n=1 Tax=Bombardia bombarda TaxID=252184 RepID=A0AA39X751_9PEZI|nr:hypothetical protein B0T17DRAFT_523014 [Bombardia bombarda]
MPYVIDNFDDTIDGFFAKAGASLSREKCDEFARRRYGGEIRPVDNQRANSYTITAGPSSSKIIQFRAENDLLDTRMLRLAKAVHTAVVADCLHLGWIGNPDDGPQLAIYEMDRLPGEKYVIARDSHKHDRRLNTVHSLARFFAQSWQNSLPQSSKLVNMSAIMAECYARFWALARALPPRFRPAVAEVQDALVALLDPSSRYPLVLTHSDLKAMNMLVDPESGNITGVADWASASILPFGFGLYALANVFGKMDRDGWKWFDDADELRGAFWRVFGELTGLEQDGPQMRLVKVAEKGGILIRYGTIWDSKFSGMVGCRDPHDFGGDFEYLDALLL